MANYPDLKLYIGGEWKHADGAPVINPADESVLGTVPHASRSDLDDALAAAEHGFKLWSRTAPVKRTEIILKAAQIIRTRVEEMAVAMTLEQGKPIAQSRLEILRGCEILEWDAQEGRRVYGRIIPGEPGMRHSVLRQPIGVGRRLLAVEFSHELAGPQGRRRTVGGLLDHPEGVGGNPRRRGAAGAGFRRCRTASWRAEPGCSACRRRSPST